jgi:hypothetical protein
VPTRRAVLSFPITLLACNTPHDRIQPHEVESVRRGTSASQRCWWGSPAKVHSRYSDASTLWEERSDPRRCAWDLRINHSKLECRLKFASRIGGDWSGTTSPLNEFHVDLVELTHPGCS